MNPEDLNEMRMLSLAAGTLLPLVEAKRQDAYDKLLGIFRHKGEHSLALLAEVNAYQSIIDDINYKLQSLEAISNKENS